MARADTTATTEHDTAPAQPDEWRLRYKVGDLTHYTMRSSLVAIKGKLT